MIWIVTIERNFINISNTIFMMNQNFSSWVDHVYRTCVPKEQQGSVLDLYHSSFVKEHYVPRKIALKVLQFGLFWPELFNDSSK